MTRAELLEIKRTELINELFGIASQLASAVFETVEQIDGLASRKASLEKEILKLEERIAKLNSEQ